MQFRAGSRLLAIVLVRILQRNRTDRLYKYIYREIHFRKLAHAIVGLASPKSAGHACGLDPEKSRCCSLDLKAARR